MPETPKSQSWWQTLPGVLTALAAIITAVTGLLAALYQAGVIGHKERGDAAAVSTAKPPAAAASPDTAKPAATASTAPKPWSEAQAVVSASDGSSTTLRAETLSNCISVAHDLTLESGQNIDFEKMRAFEILKADPPGAPNAKASVRITLLDGSTLDGRVQANCDLFGFNDLGRYAITFQRLKRVEFRR